MEEYISGEKHREIIAGRSTASVTSQPLPKLLLVAAIAIVLLGLAFYSGVAYQKGHQPKTSQLAAGGSSGQYGPGGRNRFGGQRRNIGQVTAVSDSSITITNMRTGTESIFSISSDTKITNNGQTIAASSIKVGDTVLIVPATDKTKAASILVNPGFGGNNSSSNPNTGTPDTSTTPTITN